MAYSGISNVTTAVAQVLHAQFKDQVLKTLGDVPEMEHFKKYKTDLKDLPPESLTFKVMTGEGSESIQPQNPSSRLLPAGREVEFEEGSYRVKEVDSGLEFGNKELEALERAMSSGLEFGNKELEALERAMSSGDITSGAFVSSQEYIDSVLKAKTQVLRQKLLVDIFGDGTGVLGTVASIDKTNVAAGSVAITLAQAYTDRGHSAWFRLRSSGVVASTAGTLRVVTGAATFDHLRFDSIDTSTGVITCSLRSATNTLVTGGSDIDVIATDVIYYGDKAVISSGYRTLPDLTAIVLGTTDMDAVGPNLCGLGSLVAADGRKVQGLIRSGIHASTVHSVGGNLTPSALEDMIIKINRRWQGMDAYNWNQFILAPEALNYLIRTAQSDRRLIGSNDGVPAAYGSTKFVFKEGVSGREVSWQFLKSMLCPLHTVYLLPDSGGDNHAFAYPHSEMKECFKGSEGSGFLPKPSTIAGHYEDARVKYEKMYHALFSKIPAALAKCVNFTMS